MSQNSQSEQSKVRRKRPLLLNSWYRIQQIVAIPSKGSKKSLIKWPVKTVRVEVHIPNKIVDCENNEIITKIP